ncbi:MAG: DUF4173 domain-containing protein [Acidimicrobiales bacterium]
MSTTSTPCFDAPHPPSRPVASSAGSASGSREGAPFASPGLVPPPPPLSPPGSRAPRWSRGGGAGGSGAGTAPARTRPEVPAARSAVLGWVLAAAALGDVAIRLPAGTLAGSAVALCLVGLVGAAGGLRTGTQRVVAALVVAASSAFVLRASPWVAWITGSAVAALVLLAAADGLRTDRGPTWLRSAGAWFAGLVSVPAWLSAFVDRLPRVGPGRAGQAARAALAAAVVLVLLGGLLASGDAVFGAVLTSFRPGAGVDHLVVTAVLFVPLAGLAVLALRSHGPGTGPHDRAAGDTATPSGRLRVESRAARWAAAGLLSLWCGVQLVVVSGGARTVIQSQGLTVAEYARQGFFQLVAVAALSLAVLNLTQRFLGLGAADKGPAAVIGIALIVLVAATFARLAYYMDAYGLTMLRLAVATFLGWLALMTVLSVARSLGVAPGRAWLQSATVLSAAAVAVAYAWANPAAIVARANLARAIDPSPAAGARPLDVPYLLRLGPDARGPIAAFDWSDVGGRPDSVTRWLCAEGDASAGYGILGWNLSRAAGPADDGSC